MAYVLIVEDIPDTARILAMVIKAHFSDWTIDSAGSVSEARQKLADGRRPYDFAVLDFKLPDKPGEEAKGELSLCTQIRHRTPATRVVHTTAYRDDPELALHVGEVLLRDNDDEHVIPKDTHDWMERVVARLQAFLHGDRIEAKLNALFEPIQASRREFREAPKGGSVTNRLIDLCAATRLHWNLLTPSVQRSIKSKLNVDDSRPGDVRVSLIGEVKSE